VQTSALLVFAAASPLLGRLVDRFGPKYMLLAGVFAQALSSAVTGLAGSVWHLFVSRFLYEIRPLHSSQVLINRWFVSRRGAALGISATSMPVGMLALSPLSQYLVQSWGWRETLLFWAGVTVLILLPLFFVLRDSPQDKGCTPDGEIKAATAAAEATETSGHRLAEAVRTGAFWLLGGTHVICGIGCGFVMTHTVIFATDIGYTAMVGASLLSVMGGVNLAGVLVTGHMSDRFRRSRVLALTHCIRGLAFLTIVIVVLAGGGPLWLLYLAVAMFGFGFFTTAPLVAGLVGDLFGNRRMGTIMGVVLATHMVGTAIGSFAGGLIYELTGSYLTFFAIQGGLELLAAVFAFAIRRQSGRS
jgi:predicted MFS family arabinose efflux permease